MNYTDILKMNTNMTTTKDRIPPLSLSASMKRAQSIRPQWHRMCDPEVLNYVQALANSIGCPEEHLYFPLLSITAALVSTKVTIQVTESWQEPAILWSAVLAKQGEMKSPSMNILLHALSDFEMRKELENRQILQNNSEHETMDSRFNDTPSLILDERSYNQSTLRDVLAAQDNRMLMVAKDLSFMCQTQCDKPGFAENLDRERKYVLSAIYNGKDPDFSATSNQPMCLNVTGFFSPKQAISILTEDSIDPIISHILLSCPLERDCFMEDLTPFPKYLPPMSLIFHIIHQANKRRLTYHFHKDALTVVNEYLNELNMQKRSIPHDEHQRYILTKARAQFCRLSLICHILRDAMKEAIQRSEQSTVDPENSDIYAVNNQWRTSIVSIEAVQQAKAVMGYFVDQKLALLSPDHAPMRHEREPERKHVATPVVPVPVSFAQRPHPQLVPIVPKPVKPKTPPMNPLQEMQKSAQEILSQMSSSRDLINHFRQECPKQESKSPPAMARINGLAQVQTTPINFVPNFMASSPTMVPMPRMFPYTTNSQSVAQPDLRESPIALTNANRNRKNPNPYPNQSRTPTQSTKLGGRTPTIVGVEENGTYKYDFSNLMKFALKNMRSLLTCGYSEVSASIVAGRHLMPPAKTPGTENRYKTEAAVAYLEKVAELGFGTTYRTNKKSTVFKKHTWEELSPKCHEILEKMQVTEDAYKRVKTLVTESDRVRRIKVLNRMNEMMAQNGANYDVNLSVNTDTAPVHAKQNFARKGANYGLDLSANTDHVSSHVKEDYESNASDIAMDVDTGSERSNRNISPSIGSNPPAVVSPPNIASRPPSATISPPTITATPQTITGNPQTFPMNLSRQTPPAMVPTGV